jgi:hypothetical protein
MTPAQTQATELPMRYDLEMVSRDWQPGADLTFRPATEAAKARFEMVATINVRPSMLGAFGVEMNGLGLKVEGCSNALLYTAPVA